MSQSHSATLTLPVGERDHFQGAADAPVTLVEYGDYECPFCGAAYVTIKEIQEAFGDQLKFVFRNFPLSEMHPHAKDAAEAAEAAGAQGSFWEMHDTLYENQSALTRDDIAGYAQNLGLDASCLMEEVTSAAYSKRIQEDFRSGVRSGVNGTPTFFINSTRYDGPRDFESFIAALKARII